MTVPNPDLEATLRRELSTAASRVEPGDDGLERIRARTGKHPPLPWLLSVLLAVADRARYWVWRGHWAWPDSAPRPGSGQPSPLAFVRTWLAAVWTWLASGRRGGNVWLRPVAVLAGITFIAAITFATPPLREVIENVGNNVLPGGQTSGGAGTNGHGSPASTGGGGALTNGSAGTATTGLHGTGGSASPSPTATAQCTPTPSGSAQAGSTSQIAQVVNSALPVTTATACSKPGATALPVTAPSQKVPTTGPSVTVTTPAATGTASPTGSPSVTPTDSPTPTGSDTGSPSPTSTAGG